MVRSSVVALALTLAVPSALHAQAAPETSNRALAVAHYERGREAYAAGRYRLAVYELEMAYSLDNTGTNLLLNLGMVHERIGHLDAAILAYERLLTATTDPEERARIEQVLTRLRGARPELADISRRHGRADGIFWAAAGGALTCGALGVTMFLTRRPGANDEAAPLAFSVSGAALALLAGVLYFAREAPERHTLFVNASLVPGAGTVGVAGTF